MNPDDWKHPMQHLMDLFERESTIWLRKINQCFVATGRPFDDEFRQYFLKMSSLRLDTSFNAVQYEQNNEKYVQMASNSSAPDQDNQIVANANVSSSVERSVDHQNVPRPGNLLESNAPVNMYFDNNDPDDDYDGIDLTTENGDEVFVKREPKVENEIEIDEVDLPVVQFDPNEYNARYASVASGTRRSKLMNKKILQSSSSIAQKQRNRYDIRIAKLKVNADDSRRKPHGNQHQRLQGHHKSIVGCENNRSLWDCGRCMCLFSQESEMNEHEKCCQKRRYECERCNKFVTVNRSSMRKHTRLHCS